MIRIACIAALVLVASSPAWADSAPPERSAKVYSAKGRAMPKQIDRNMIMWSVARVSSKIRGCTTGLSFTGIVKLNAVVARDGTVTSVTVEKTPHEYLGTCMSDALKTAVFPKTAQGGTFTRTISVSPNPV